jgi:hypothetical protein
MMFVFRPRVGPAGRYLRADDDEDHRGGRAEILLEDLDAYAINEGKPGMSEWDGYAALPPQPIVISLDEKKARDKQTHQRQARPDDTQEQK